MRRILWLAYYFPPIGGAGTQRSLKFTRYLPQHGYASTIVTAAPSDSNRWTPEDATLANEIPPEVRVVRVPESEPSTGRWNWRARAERWVRIDSPWTRWWVEGATKLALEHPASADLVYASLSPYPTAFAASQVAEQLSVPWVADLRDPWALDEMMVFPTGLHRSVELRRMRRLLASAAAVVVTTSEASERIRDAFPELSAKTIVVIPNGYDDDDFKDDVLERNDDVFRIVHTGYLHTELGRAQRRTRVLRRIVGGEVAGLDILTRSHLYLLRAIDLLEKEIRSRIEVHLAGVLSGGDAAAANDVVHAHGYLAHDQSLDLVRTADLLFLPMQNLPAGTRATIVPGKMYEYLASGRPILAAVPDGDARDILAAAGNALICRPDDTSAMADAIRNAFISRSSSRLSQSTVDRLFVAQFERRNLTARLASVLDEVVWEHGLEKTQRA